VDYFDFPLDPPDAGNVRGGQDFSVYRERYSGIHTGEDWWYASGSSLGMPVYSIGYGQVSYAHTLGWGRDLGTLVIRHVMQSGRTLYSFYGHLDPDSLDLRRGDCVTRGQVVGLIGDPRSPPHLHFEVRSVFASQPGPGYWSSEPEQAGWFPPSQTIEDSRLAISPGLQWWSTMDGNRVRYLGELDSRTALVEVDDELLAFDLDAGEILARAEIPGLHSYTRWDPARRWLITADMSGRVQTRHVLFESADEEHSLVLTPVWLTETHHIGGLTLLAMPNNWLGLVQGTSLTVIDPGGGITWQADLEGRLQSWLQVDGQLLITTDGLHPEIWSITHDGAQAWGVDISGVLLSTPSGPFLYTRDGLYRLDTSLRQAEEWIAWDMADLDSAQVIELPDGEFLVNLRSLESSYLIWLAQNGELIERARYDEAIDHDQAVIHTLGDDVFLVTQIRGTSSLTAAVYQIIPPNRLQLVFRTVTRRSYVSEGWSTVVNDSLLLALQGVRWILITP
jgi:murein DD-endopeptidase MepM/ murein hydrolase activator NlpD